MLIFGVLAYYCHRIYRDEFQEEFLRAVGLVGMIVSLMFLAYSLYFMVLGGANLELGYVESEESTIPVSPVSR